MSMEDRDGFIWFDGDLRPWREARVHVLSYTFQTGVGVFEGTRAYRNRNGSAIFRLDDHIDRLFSSAKILCMDIPFSRAELMDAHLKVIRSNKLEGCYLRTNVMLDGQVVGISAAGNGVHVSIAPWKWDSYLGGAAAEEGIRVITSSFSRHHVNAAMLKAKANGHYINSMLAITEAKRLGFQDALLLDSSGYVAECTTSNIFMVKGSRLITPTVNQILLGITRDTIMRIARATGIEIEERLLTRDELYCADEIFVTGTAAEVTPVVEIDGRTIGDGKRGSVTEALQSKFNATVRAEVPEWDSWLTQV